MKFLKQLNPLIFERSWLFIPMLMFLFFGIQSLVGLVYLGGDASIEFMEVISVGLLAYVALNRLLSHGTAYPRATGKLILFVGPDALRFLIVLVSLVYFSVVILALLSAEKVALWEAIRGASASEIAEAREMLFRARTGPERILVYLNAILSTAFMPYVVMLAFMYRSKLAWPVFAFFALSLTFSMEKALILKAMLPLFLLALNGMAWKKLLLIAPMIALSVLTGLAHLAKGSDNGASVGSAPLSLVDVHKGSRSDHAKPAEPAKVAAAKPTKPAEAPKPAAATAVPIAPAAVMPAAAGEAEGASAGSVPRPLIDVHKGSQGYGEGRAVDFDQPMGIFQGNRQLTLKDHVSKYFPLRFSTSLGYLLNRMLWIPYVTAYDWLKYFREELAGRHLYGATSLFVSKLLGIDRVMMEQKVFDYQFGLGPTRTAAANTNFMVDAYVNFGFFGVVVLSALVGASVAFINWLANPAATACIYTFLFQLVSGGFFGVFLGGGLFLFLCLVYFVRPSADICSAYRDSGCAAPPHLASEE